jgi:hypothetical protein
MLVPAYPRTLGLLTLGYGAYTLARPESLVHAADLAPRGEDVSRSGRTLGRLVGARDLLSGVAMLVAPAGLPLRAAVTARVACDASDVVGFGLSVPPRSRVKVVAVAAGWGLLCATSFRSAGRRR